MAENDTDTDVRGAGFHVNHTTPGEPFVEHVATNGEARRVFLPFLPAGDLLLSLLVELLNKLEAVRDELAVTSDTLSGIEGSLDQANELQRPPR